MLDICKLDMCKSTSTHARCASCMCKTAHSRHYASQRTRHVNSRRALFKQMGLRSRPPPVRVCVRARRHDVICHEIHGDLSFVGSKYRCAHSAPLSIPIRTTLSGVQRDASLISVARACKASMSASKMLPCSLDTAVRRARGKHV